jgi:hypothetical protein
MVRSLNSYKNKRISLRNGSVIVLSRKDLQIIDLIMEVMEENQPKISMLDLQIKVCEKLGGKNVRCAWNRNHIKYCLMILHLKGYVSLKNCIASKQTNWRTWIWFPKNSKRLTLKKNKGMW